MSEVAPPVEDTAKQVPGGTTVEAGTALEDVQLGPDAVVAPMPLEEMARQTPPMSTTQSTAEKAPKHQIGDEPNVVDNEHPRKYSTVPGTLGAGGASSGGGAAPAETSSSPDESWTLAQLQAEASARGLPTSGTKAELVERLTA